MSKLTCFVYGTLMQGMGNERVISMFPRSVERVKVSGYDMYNVGGFPALVKGTHDYYGELITFDESVSAEALYANMDRLEGYRKDAPQTSMYLRVPIEVEKISGEKVMSEVYLWNYSIDGLEFIDSANYSDYREFRLKGGKNRW